MLPPVGAETPETGHLKMARPEFLPTTSFSHISTILSLPGTRPHPVPTGLPALIPLR